MHANDGYSELRISANDWNCKNLHTWIFIPTKHTSDYTIVMWAHPCRTPRDLNTVNGPTNIKPRFLINLLPLCIRCTLVTRCCGTHLSPLSVTHALCIENANCEKAKWNKASIKKKHIWAYFGHDWTTKNHVSRFFCVLWNELHSAGINIISACLEPCL